MLDGDPRIPIYLRLRDELAARIASQEWRAGEAIPSESELAGRYGVAVGTLRKTLDLLVAEGQAADRIHPVLILTDQFLQPGQPGPGQIFVTGGLNYLMGPGGNVGTGLTDFQDQLFSIPFGKPPVGRVQVFGTQNLPRLGLPAVGRPTGMVVPDFHPVREYQKLDFEAL